MSKKKLGLFIGLGAVALVIVTVIVTVLVMKGCAEGASDNSDKNTEVVTDAEGNTVTDNQEDSTKASGDSIDEDNNQSSSDEVSKGVVAAFNPSNTWESGGKVFVQYGLVVTNNSDTDVSSWTIKLPIEKGLTVDNKWCCATEVSGNYLLIKPESYNAAIAKGANISNIGIVLVTDSEHTITNYVMEADGKTTDNVVADNNNSGNSDDSGNSGNSGGSSDNNSGGSDTNYTPATPPEAYGGLHVVGTKLVDAKGNEIQLKGPSTHGLQWFPDYVNYEGFKTFRDDWGANVIRLAMYAREGGYVGGDQAKLKKLIDNGVTYATQLGMYVIIDWHVLSYNPNETKNEAITFFDEMAKKYANNPNVIYEICNEPTGAPWASQIKPYAESVISTIRKHDNDALIIVGTNTWSQDVHEVKGNKINDHNVIYALHFYAATHKDDLRNRMKAALDAGVPIFVSECSICDASGNGGIDYNSANAWIKVMDEYKVSYIAWNISNKNESSALIKSGVNKLSGWTVDELSETGKWWRKIFRGEY